MKKQSKWGGPRRCKEASCKVIFTPHKKGQLYHSKRCQNRDGQRRWREKVQAALAQQGAA